MCNVVAQDSNVNHVIVNCNTKTYAMANYSGCRNKAEFSVVSLLEDYMSANIVGKGHVTFTWEESSRWPSSASA